MAWSMTTQTGDIKQLATLVEVSQTLASTLNLESALHRVLEILEYHHSMVPSMVTLLHEQSSELAIAVLNLTINAREAMPRGGTVIVHGENVPRVQDDELAGVDGPRTVRAKGLSDDVCRSIPCLACTSLPMTATGATIQPRRRPGASVLENVPRYST